MIAGGRRAFEKQDWIGAYERLCQADRETPLDAEDLERLAVTTELLGLDPESATFWTRAHREHLARERVGPAVRCAFWLAYGLLNSGESSQAAGWISRARRLLDSSSPDCVEQGYLLFTAAFQAIGEGRNEAARMEFQQAAAMGEHHRDRDLVAMCRHGEGRTLIRLGEISQGLGLLDEAMVAVTAGEVSPLVAGGVYCGVLSACQETFDIRRAREWTAALHTWCAGQSGLVAFRGQCLVRRAEVARWRGDWGEAEAEAERACAHFAKAPGQPGAGEASYQLGEVHRLRGEWAEADEAYRQANRLGRRPQPGMALLSLARGQVDAAAAAIGTALAEAKVMRSRSQLLPAFADIMLAAGDMDRARAAVDELRDIAAEFGSPLLEAAAAQAEGLYQLTKGDAATAVTALRRATRAWRDLDVPYEAARTGALAAIACGLMGDRDTADLELEGARQVLAGLGALAELERLQLRFQPPVAPPASGGLTGRERQVLALVATGKTNRAIASELTISEKTVARHLSNIFTKLGLSSRAAATAYAYEKRLVTSER